MAKTTLFELPEPQEPSPAPPSRPDEARVLKPVRQQLQWLPRNLEEAVPENHPARAIWGFLEELDLSAFYAPIKALLDRPGRPTTDPVAAGYRGRRRQRPPSGPSLPGA